MKKLIIKQKHKCQIVKVYEIIFCKSSSNYSTIYLKDQNAITIPKCLTQLTSELNGDFIRVSQSYLVNVHHINEIIPSKKQLSVVNGEVINFTIKFTELIGILENKFSSQNEVENENN